MVSEIETFAFSTWSSQQTQLVLLTMALFAALESCFLSDLAVYTLTATVAVLLFCQIRAWYRLRHIPGPWSAPWSVWWQLRGAMSGVFPQTLKEATDRYGVLCFGLLHFCFFWGGPFDLITCLRRSSCPNWSQSVGILRPRGPPSHVCCAG